MHLTHAQGFNTLASPHNLHSRQSLPLINCFVVALLLSISSLSIFRGFYASSRIDASARLYIRPPVGRQGVFANVYKMLPQEKRFIFSERWVFERSMR